MGRFAEAIEGTEVALIAEFKRKSPWTGDIAPDATPREFVDMLQEEGIFPAAISVLCDDRWGGDFVDIALMREAVGDLPLLAKGVFRSAFAAFAAQEQGADAMLVVATTDAPDVIRAAHIRGLDVALEVGPREELSWVAALRHEALVLNRRDLWTGQISESFVETHYGRAQRFTEAPLIAASGYSLKGSLAEAEYGKVDAVLIGEGLVREPSR